MKRLKATLGYQCSGRKKRKDNQSSRQHKALHQWQLLGRCKSVKFVKSTQRELFLCSKKKPKRGRKLNHSYKSRHFLRRIIAFKFTTDRFHIFSIPFTWLVCQRTLSLSLSFSSSVYIFVLLLDTKLAWSNEKGWTDDDFH